MNLVIKFGKLAICDTKRQKPSLAVGASSASTACEGGNGPSLIARGASPLSLSSLSLLYLRAAVWPKVRIREDGIIRALFSAISFGNPSVALISLVHRAVEGAHLRTRDHPCAFLAFSLVALPSRSYPQVIAQLKMRFREIGVFVA